MKKKKLFHLSLALALSLVATLAKAQTADDAIMMSKKQWCNGLTYMHSSWNNYWEGTTKRENKNLGTVTTQSVMLMSNYGITDKLNVIGIGSLCMDRMLLPAPLHGMKGFQDIELDVKYEFLRNQTWKRRKFITHRGRRIQHTASEL